MRMLVLDGAGRDLAGVESAFLNRAHIARVDASEPAGQRYAFAGWTLDELTRNLVSPLGRRIDLTSSEFDLLTVFLRHPGGPLSREVLVRLLRGREWRYFDRSIDTLVARLRKKLTEGADALPVIRSVRGVGYVFCAAVARLESRAAA